MLDVLLCSAWFIFGAYSFWFITQAKTFQPMTLDQLALTWKLHKQQAGCKATRIHSILTKNDEAIGFKCDCGHEFLQRRLITQKVRVRVPKKPQQVTKVSRQNLDLNYSSIKKI